MAKLDCMMHLSPQASLRVCQKVADQVDNLREKNAKLLNMYDLIINSGHHPLFKMFFMIHSFTANLLITFTKSHLQKYQCRKST